GCWRAPFVNCLPFNAILKQDIESKRARKSGAGQTHAQTVVYERLQTVAGQPPIQSVPAPTPSWLDRPTSASGSLAIFASRNTSPFASTTHTLELSSDTSIPA